jgi:predicted N-acetyltransferase YhbS
LINWSFSEASRSKIRLSQRQYQTNQYLIWEKDPLKIDYKKLNKSELSEIKNIDRSDYSDSTFYVNNGKLVSKNIKFDHPGFNSKQWDRIANNLEKEYEKGDIFFGAFDGVSLIGIVGLEVKLRGESNDMLNLSALWISKRYRRLGIGKRLTEMAKDEAKKKGATMLYVSGTYSKNTIDFYFSLGCRLVSKLDEDLYKKEPDDIHMELDI